MEKKPKRNSTNGRMTTQFTFWCVVVGCTKWKQVDCSGRSLAGRQVRHAGWELTKHSGWRCPECSQKARNAYAGR